MVNPAATTVPPTLPTSGSQAAIGGMGWTGSMAFAKGVLQIAAIALLARWVTPAEFGIAAAAAVLFEVVRTAGQLSMDKVILRRSANDPALVATARSLALISGCWWALVLIAVADLAERQLGVAGTASFLRFAAIAILFHSLSLVPIAVLSRARRFKTIALAEVISALVATLIGVVTAIAGWGQDALLLVLVLQAGLLAWLVCRATREPLRLALQRQHVRTLLIEGSGSTLARLFNSLVQQAPAALSANILGGAGLGLLNRSQALARMPAMLLLSSLERVALPLLSQLHDDLPRLRAAYVRATTLTAACGFMLSGAMWLSASDLVLVLLGPTWSGAVVAFQAMALMAFAHLSMRICGAICQALGRTWLWAWLNAAHLVLVCAAVWFARDHGLQGIAIALALAMQLSHLLCAAVANRVTEVSTTTWLAAHAAPLLMAIIACGAGWLTMHVTHDWQNLPRLVLTGTAVAGTTVIWISIAPERLRGSHLQWLHGELHQRVRRLLCRGWTPPER